MTINEGAVVRQILLVLAVVVFILAALVSFGVIGGLNAAGLGFVGFALATGALLA